MSIEGKVTNIFGTAPNFVIHVEIVSEYGQFPLVFRVKAPDHNSAKHKTRELLWQFGVDFAKSFNDNTQLK